MKQEKRRKLAEKGILVLKKHDEERELEFELDYLESLSLEERFALMLSKSRELRINLDNNGHLRAPANTNRK